MWYGSLEMYNFRITDVNGYRAVVWGGMTTGADPPHGKI